MSDVGMNLVEQIGAHAAAAMAAVNEPRAGDPGRAFATVSRAVRMTLALEGRVDGEILALHRGEFPAPRRVRAPAAVEIPATEAPIPAAKVRDPRRDRAGDAVREAIRLEVETITDAREALDALNERLFDTESYDVLLNLPSATLSPPSAPISASIPTGACGARTPASSPRPAAAASTGRCWSPRRFLRRARPAPQPRA